MKVLFFTSIFPSLSEPTRGPYNHNIVLALSKSCEIKVVSPQPFWSRIKNPKSLGKTPFETQTGIDVVLPTYWSVPKLTSLHGNSMYRSVKPCVEHLYQDFPFDIIFAVWAYPDAVAAAQLARDFNCPLLIKTMGSDVNVLCKIPKIESQITQAFQKASYVVSVSKALQEKVISTGISKDRSLVQHNGVNGDRFTIKDKPDAKKRLNLPLDKSILCYIGRLGAEKGVDILIKSINKIKSKNIELHIIGWGDQEIALKAQVDALGIGNQVIFHGMRPHHEVPQWLNACDLFCLPSRREGCPNVVLESLASGRPVVASNVGGVPELINGSNGVLVESEDPDALAKGIDEALSRTWDPEQLRNSVEFLSWETVGARYHQILTSAYEGYRK